MELLFSSHGVGSGKQTQATRLRSKHFYLLSHLTDPSCSFKNEVCLRVTVVGTAWGLSFKARIKTQ